MITVIVILLLVSLYITMTMFTFGFVDEVFPDENGFNYFSAMFWPVFIIVVLSIWLIEFTIRFLGKRFSGVINSGRNLGKWFERGGRI